MSNQSSAIVDQSPPKSESTPASKTRPANASTESGPGGAQKKKRGPLFWLIAIAVLIGGGSWVFNFVHRSILFEETDDAYITGHIHQISSQAPGSVTEVLVKNNEVVKSGQVLARLNPLEYEIAVQKAKAALDQEKAGVLKAKAALEQAKAEHAQAQAQATSAEAQMQQIDTQLQMANVNYARNERLFKTDPGSVSGADRDNTRLTLQATTSALAGAKATHAAASARAEATAAAMDSVQAEIGAAEARVSAQEAMVRDAERELSYTSITAPADGRIGNKNIEVGNLVQMGQALFALVGGDYWIIANFKESQIKKMQMGQPVEITVDAIAGKKFDGKLDSLAPATGAQFALLPPDNSTGNFTKVVQRVPVKIVFNPESIRGFEDRLRPGLSTVISVKVK